jgi:hypothetical protein
VTLTVDAIGTAKSKLKLKFQLRLDPGIKTNLAMTKSYPKGIIRRIVKAHEPQHKLSKNSDVLVQPAVGQCVLTTGLPRLCAVHQELDERGGHCSAGDG